MSLTACGNSGWYSEEKFEEISENYLTHCEDKDSEKSVEFFQYEAEGLAVGSIYYGYYFSAENEILIPDFYLSDNLGEKIEGDGGIYFGKPNNGTDWCFIKQITDKWFYFELHWG